MMTNNNHVNDLMQRIIKWSEKQKSHAWDKDLSIWIANYLEHKPLGHHKFEYKEIISNTDIINYYNSSQCSFLEQEKHFNGMMNARRGYNFKKRKRIYSISLSDDVDQKFQQLQNALKQSKSSIIADAINAYHKKKIKPQPQNPNSRKRGEPF